MLTRQTLRCSLQPTRFIQLARPARTLHLSVKGTGTGVAQTITAGPLTIQTDTYKSLGGNETAPSPLSYSLASLSGCTQVTGSLVAKDLGIKLGRWEVEVEAVLDTDVLVGGKEGEGNWERVRLRVRVETDVGDEGDGLFERFSEEVERRCTLTRLFVGSGVGWKSEWVNVKLS